MSELEAERVAVVVPLLSSYKYGLLCRRLFQVIFGGPRARKVPWYVYLIQGGMWVLPLALSIPFIILDGLGLWNQYFLALVYGCTVGVSVLVGGVVVKLLRWYWQRSPSERIEYDDELDEVVIPTCLGLETLDFVFSSKRLFNVVLHPVISGVLCFAGFFVLLPSVMQESLPTVGVVIVSLLGWFAMCIAHYSLSVRAPPETAVYRPVDPLELKFLNRPFHVMIISSVFIALRKLIAEPALYHQLLYSFLSLLPLGWVLGVLPPLDAFCPWLMEQVLTRLLGGSPLATDLRLFVIFVASVVSVAIVVSVSDTVSFMLLTVFGFFLSRDMFKHFKAILSLLCSKQHNRIARFVKSSCKCVFKKTFVSYAGGALLLTLSLICVYFTSTVDSPDTRQLLARVFSGIVITLRGYVSISDSLQRPYILGVIRNHFYPKLTGNVAIFKAKKKKLQYVSVPRRLILATVAPLMMFALVGVGLSDSSNVTPILWQRIVTARVLRGIWQNSVSSLSELALVSILILVLPTDNTWISLGLPTQALIVGLLLQVTKDFLLKASFIVVSLITFLWIRKHRTYLVLNVFIIAGSIIFLPLLVVVVLISSLFSAPLLTLFTLPIFSTSFPRTQRFWPSLLDYGSTYLKSTEETIYYQQAEPEMAKAVYRSLSHGAVPLEPGTQLLLRFGNRLALVTLLEVGQGFCTVNTRGLELQETSCHSEEATKIDDIIEALHNPKSRSQTLLNTNILNTLSLVDSVVIQTYSDAHNVLTGIIDQPTNLQQFSSKLIKTLIFVFNSHIKSTIATSTPTPAELQPELGKIATPIDIDDGLETESPVFQKSKHLSVACKEDNSKSVYNTYLGNDNISWSSVSSIPDLRPVKKMSVTQPAVENWLDSTHGLIPQDIPVERKSTDMGPLPPLPNHQDSRPRSSFWLDSTNGLIPWDVPVEGKSALPSQDIRRKSSLTQSMKQLSGTVSPKDFEYGVSPLKWTQPPLNRTHIFRLMQKFPHEWLSYLNDGVALDSDIFELLSRTVVGCFSLLDVPASAQASSDRVPKTYPLDIYRRFCGDVPYSPHLSWMKEQPTIWKLALKAYRYAVKLMYDEGCLGEVEDWEELADYLKEYDQKWCIVAETESAWGEGILANTPFLFSLGHDRAEDVYTAHVLSLQDEVVHIGILNSAALGGIWSDLALELLYLTNDDEERYSIQAHAHLLRNLSIQTAEPPLGYTVYSSGLLSIPPI